MRQSSEEPKFSKNELNKILPSYILNEVEEDKNLQDNIKGNKINNYFKEKVS